MRKILYQKEAKERLDKFLNNELLDFSRSQIQKLIKAGQIKVNDESTSVHRFLKTGDKITFEEKSQEASTIEVPDKITQPAIIAETEDYFVINKPAGLIVHPATGVKEKTLTDWLLEKYPNIRDIGENPARPGIVHRLDKEVSGLMVIAGTQRMFDYLKKQFQSHQLKKEYLGLVHGVIKTDIGQINFPLKRSKLTGKIVARPQKSEGKDAITKFEVIKRFVNYTYLKLTLLTGRTHQIRAHLQAYGYPLVGDKLYKNKKIKDKLNLDRIFLHSAVLGFNDLNEGRQEFNLDLPEDLQNILNSTV
ncbi:RluA family pseudouridine synthase [Patescibacteria group bacterium]|nr:RluA family pseudouridine synthase [Patescibacteria group bacterium]